MVQKCHSSPLNTSHLCHFSGPCFSLTLPLIFQEVLESEEEDDEEEEEDENDTGAGGFNVIPPFSEKVTVTNLGSEAGRVHSRAATLSEPHFLFAVLLLIALSWG